MTTPSETSTEQLSTADFAAAGERRAQRDVSPTLIDNHAAVDQNREPVDPSGNPVATANRAEMDASRTPADAGGAPVERKRADQPAGSASRAALFADNESQEFRGRWSDVQAGFVDEPRQAVEQADVLVAEVMQRLATVFADERRKLEQQWDRGTDTDTEELRLALQRYRSFFDRLLTM